MNIRPVCLHLCKHESYTLFQFTGWAVWWWRKKCFLVCYKQQKLCKKSTEMGFLRVTKSRFTIGDEWVIYSHIVCVLYVNPISVGALSSCFYCKWFYMYVLATVEPKMELRTVLDSQSFHYQVRAHEEPYCLKTESNQLGIGLIITSEKRKKI